LWVHIFFFQDFIMIKIMISCKSKNHETFRFYYSSKSAKRWFIKSLNSYLHNTLTHLTLKLRGQHFCNYEFFPILTQLSSQPSIVSLFYLDSQPSIISLFYLDKLGCSFFYDQMSHLAYTYIFSTIIQTLFFFQVINTFFHHQNYSRKQIIKLHYQNCYF